MAVNSGARKSAWVSVQCKIQEWEAARRKQPKTLAHEFIAEAFGTFTLIMFGNGVVASKHMQAANAAQMGAHPDNDTFGGDQFVNMGWGLAVAFGVLASFESSGAHLNPAVTFSNMIFSDISPAKGMVYMAGQLLGAFLGALVVSLNYVALKGGAALTNFYCTAPFAGVSTANAFLQEFICTALLVAGISAIVSGSPATNKFHVAGFVGLLVFAIGNCFGAQTGYAMNPARDLGPRVVYALFYSAYGKDDLYTTVFGGTSGFYFLIPLIAPMLGGPLGLLLHKLCSHTEPEPKDATALSEV